ncbi:MAG: ATP-dependent zinc metalloprotease FtsH [Aerococcus sp.]|nr:ATP-dependent zinc metalloprotease FtsH [Aerococcus sp.]
MQRGNQPKRPNSFLKSGLLWVLVFFALLAIVNMFTGTNSGSQRELTQSEFVQQLRDGKVKEFEMQPKAGTFEVTGTYKATDNKEQDNQEGVTIFDNRTSDRPDGFIVDVLPNDGTINQITEAADATGTHVKALEESQAGVWVSLLFSALPILLFIFLMYAMTSQMQGRGPGNPMQVGKSKAKDRAKESKVRFSDVAGADEEKQELVEVVDFLKNPGKYHELGARVPKGILLEGPPGTGKTLLAKAVAGEAGVPFYSMSGSEFVEMFVGVGASRVRDLFDTAKKNAPAIIFIDEIDAVGRKRGNSMGGGHDEREQTLNQLLVELDGFEEKDNVIVIAATNRSDVLDDALLRPGRFDRQILIGRPDVKGREAILKVHARNKNLADDVDLKIVAQQTPGFTGAELENVLNEAALVAARLDKKTISMIDVDEAQDRVIAGPAKPSRQVNQKERRITAFHEAGHSICGLVLSEARVVHKVTIVPRGKAGGYNIMLPREDQNMYSAKELDEQIIGLLGGRAAEMVFFNSATTGASNDFEQATAIARQMITEYGMSEELGPISYEGSHGMRGANPYADKSYSAETAAKIDEVLRNKMNKLLDRAMEIVRDHKEQVTVIAEALLERETLNEKEIRSLYTTGELPEDDETAEMSEGNPSSYEEAKKKMQRQARERQEKAQTDDDDTSSRSFDEENSHSEANEESAESSTSQRPTHEQRVKSHSDRPLNDDIDQTQDIDEHDDRD